MENGVMIVELDRGFSQWMWLCPKHLAAMKRNGWDEKARKPAPHPLTCDICKRRDHELQAG